MPDELLAAPPGTAVADRPPPAKPAGKDKPAPEGPRDSTREVVETVVFVTVLVLLLKTFVAEAFVIPTGSMAETLYGYQKVVTCDQCGHVFPVNCSGEVDPQDGPKQAVTGCTCPNCQWKIVWLAEAVGQEPGKRYLKFDTGRDVRTYEVLREPPAWSSGDRVLVAKFLFDNDHLSRPDRHDVVVFKYPDEPQKGSVAMNYIKRLEGLPGETVGIFLGDLYTTRHLTYPNAQTPRDLDDLRRAMFVNDQQAVTDFHAGKFSIVRKPPDKMLALRRIVYDNDHQPADLVKLGVPPRWTPDPDSGWAADKPDQPRTFKMPLDKRGLQWVRYRHLVVKRSSDGGKPDVSAVQPQMIDNSLGYNSNEPPRIGSAPEWVGDLMLEATVTTEGAGEFVMELSKGIDRFQAKFEALTGDCVLYRVPLDAEPVELARQPTSFGKEKGKPVLLRFANFDERLTVWVGNDLPFGDGVTYPPPAKYGPWDKHDIDRPASFGADVGTITVSNVRLYRDTHYTHSWPKFHAGFVYQAPNARFNVETLYVQPGHYLCLGDNSAESSDSRYWGLVPERLMLGKAVVVYWPVPRVGVIK